MKKLIAYYSFEGNTKFVAEILARKFHSDILSIKPKKEITNHKFLKFIWGGKQVLMQESPELLPVEKDPAQYDFICITFYKTLRNSIYNICCFIIIW